MALKDLAKILAKANKEKTVEQEFLYQLEKTIQRDNTRNSKPTQAYKPSSLGGCLRQNYFMLNGEEVDKFVPSPELVGMGEIGTHRHEDIQKYISKMTGYGYPAAYIDVASYVKKLKNIKEIEGKPVPNLKLLEKRGMEQKIHDLDRNIRFMADGIIRFKNKLYVFEYKTEISFKSQSRTFIENKHAYQAGIACIIFEIPRALFIYENRDVCSKKAFLYELTEKEKKKILDKIKSCNEYLEKQEVPPKTKVKKNCKYCKYQKLCKKY